MADPHTTSRDIDEACYGGIMDDKPNTTRHSPDLWDEAYETVVTLRGSSDVPGFYICVETEYQKLLEARDAQSN